MDTKDTASPTVLIVDDDDTTRMMAIGFLSQAGFSVHEAENGTTALELVNTITPDLIVLDVEMPDISGFDVCIALRQLPTFKHTPILMLTGLDGSENIDRAYDVGATDFATKPINWSLLCHRLRYMYRTSLAVEQLSREQERLAEAQRIAKMGNWIYHYPTGVSEWSDELYRILGMLPGDIESTLENGLSFVHKHDKEHVRGWFLQIAEKNTAPAIEYRVVLKSGALKYLQIQAELESDSAGAVFGLNAIVQDFTEIKEAQNRVHQLAYYDTLTGLPNRLLFLEQLKVSLEQASYRKKQLGLLYFDLDDFKRINDTYGHAIGDQLLTEVAKRLASVLGSDVLSQSPSFKKYLVARMGGDEFAIIVKNMESVDTLEQTATKLAELVSEPYRINGYNLFTSLSIGIACSPNDSNEVDALLRMADMAMYDAKQSGRNRHVFYNETLEQHAIRRHNIDTQLRTALANDELSVNYQVQVDNIAGEIICAEALVRWTNGQLGSVPPDEFISIAEESGLIVSIGEWVLLTACQQVKKWIVEGFPVQRVAVNISIMQFMRTDFVDVVKHVLNECELPAYRLELEVTESLLVTDLDHVVSTLEQLNELGVLLSIDDFGTGYSSLSQLKYFPIDRVKIDKAFIDNIIEDESDAVITSAVIAMANSMNIQVLAEGVETEEQLTFLCQSGCHEIQGYLVSKPVTADQLAIDMPDMQALLRQYYGPGCRDVRLAG